MLLLEPEAECGWKVGLWWVKVAKGQETPVLSLCRIPAGSEDLPRGETYVLRFRPAGFVPHFLAE